MREVRTLLDKQATGHSRARGCPDCKAPYSNAQRQCPMRPNFVPSHNRWTMNRETERAVGSRRHPAALEKLNNRDEVNISGTKR